MLTDLFIVSFFSLDSASTKAFTMRMVKNGTQLTVRHVPARYSNFLHIDVIVL